MAAPGPFANTHGLTEKINPHGTQDGYGPISSTPPWRSAQNFTVEANAHNCRNLLAEQNVHWRKQGRNALNSELAGFERAAQEYERAVRDGVHVAAVQVTEVSGAEMLARMGADGHRAVQTWTSHQVL